MAKRQSLASFSPQLAKPANARATGAKVVTTDDIAEAPSSAPKYPKINVYLTAQEVRTLKLIALDQGKRISDIGAAAIREWLERNGHARTGDA